MFHWQKLGLLFSPQSLDTPWWMQEFAQAPSSLVFNDFVRIYFSCRPSPDSKLQYVSYTGFVDLDRKDLFRILRISEKPILELGELGCFDEFGIYPTSVLKVNDNSFLAYYGGWTRGDSVPFDVAIGVAQSNDGENFKKIGKGPVISADLNEPFILSGPKIRAFEKDKYHLFYIAGKKWIPGTLAEPVYKIRMATSSDGLNWERHHKDLITETFKDESQSGPDVFYYQGKYFMNFAYRRSLNYRNKSGGYRLGLAWSDDLINWHRDDKLSDLTVSETGWDEEMVSYPHILELDGSVYMFYLGNAVGRYGFGLAKLQEL